MENLHIIKKFNYVTKVSLNKKHNKPTLYITDETRGTSLEGYSAANVTKTFSLPIPKSEKENSDKIYRRTYRMLVTSK